jgi:hypothetical protein
MLRPLKRGVDVLVNNAGLQVWGHPMFEMDQAVFDKSWEVNVRGPFFCAKAFFNLLSQSSRRGRIVNIGSTVEEGPFAQAYHGVYAMSKAALTRFSNALRQEAKMQGPPPLHIHQRALLHFFVRQSTLISSRVCYKRMGDWRGERERGRVIVADGILEWGGWGGGGGVKET